MKINRKTIIIMVLALSGILIFCQGNDKEPIEISEKDPKPLNSFSGKIVFHSNFDGDNEIYLLTSERLTKITDNEWNDEFPVWSPDGTKIAYSADPKGNYDIFIMDSDGSNIKPVTSSSKDETEPSWYPDGKKINFTEEGKRLLRSHPKIFVIDLETGQQRRLLPDYSKAHGISSVSPTGQQITFTGKPGFGGWDVAVYNLETEEITFLDEGGKSCRARFSPDGKKLAYVSSDADGKGDIWIMDIDGSNKQRLTSRDDTYDYFPTWSPDGRYIAFNSSEQHDHNGDWKLFMLELETNEIIPLFDSPGNDVFPDWFQ